MTLPSLVCVAMLAVAGLAAAGEAPIGPALDRAAVVARQPERAVLTGAVLAGTRIVAVGERGCVLLSDDAGAHWRQASVPVSVTLTAVRFADARHGFAVGHGGIVLSTVDGGVTWQKRFDGTQAAALALRAAKETRDLHAMKEAERLVADGTDKPLLDLHFFDAQHGIVVGAYNLAFATDDGGATWYSVMARLDNPKALHLYTVRARGDTVLIAGEQGLALRSDDRGRSFHRLEQPYKGSFFTAEIGSADGRDLLLAGLRGNVWRSLDGGASWAQAPLPTPASVTGSAFVAGAPGALSALWLVNQAGQVLRSSSAGFAADFEALPGAPLPPLNGVLPLADGSVLALSVNGPIRVPGVVR